MLKRLFFVILFVFLICSISASNIASLGTFKIDDCVELKQTCSNCTYVNISSVLYPNSTKAISMTSMIKDGTEYSYDFCSTSVLGSYIVNGFADLDGKITVFAYDFDITGNGKVAPSGAVITTFVVLFLFVLLFMIYLIIYSLGHVVNLDFDIIDLAWNYGIFFVVVAMLMFQNFYLGNPEVESFLTLVVKIGAVTTLFLPTVYFILTLTIGTWMKQRVKGVDF